MRSKEISGSTRRREKVAVRFLLVRADTWRMVQTVIAAGVALCSVGCMSSKILTDMERVEHHGIPDPVKFRIRSVSMSPVPRAAIRGLEPFDPMNKDGTSVVVEDMLTRMVSATAVKRYPSVFVEDRSATGIPLDVHLRGEGKSKFWILDWKYAWMGGFAPVASAVLPLNWVTDIGFFDMTSSFSLPDGHDVACDAVGFRQTVKCSMAVLLPTAWIVPPFGKSRHPVVRELSADYPRKAYAQNGPILVESFVDALVTALARSDLARANELYGVFNEEELASQGKRDSTLAVATLSSQVVPASYAAALTESVRTYLVEVQAFKVVSREEMDQVLSEQSFGATRSCDSTQCLVEMGRLLTAQKIVGGSVERIGDLYVVTLRLVDVETAAIEAMIQQDVSADSEDQGLLRAARHAAVRLLNSVRKTSGGHP